MPPTPKIYVPGQDRQADQLNELYEKLNGSTLAERTEVRAERDPKDPFGLGSEQVRTDDYDVAKAVAVRLTKFFALCVQDFALSPGAAMFAAELASLNIFNAEDVPASAEEIDAARKAAYDYYVKARAALPSTASPRPER